MMNLLRKEFKLCVHPTAWLFLSFALFLLIPNYPYMVGFFYMELAVFNTAVMARENKDADFTLLMPVPKAGLVRGRMAQTVLFELAQVLLCVPVIALRNALGLPANAVGMDANLPLLALGLLFFSAFNALFFTRYYRNINKAGVPFLAGAAGSMVWMLLCEAAAHTVPFVRDVLDTPDPAHMDVKLVLFAASLLVFAASAHWTYRVSLKRFEASDV